MEGEGLVIVRLTVLQGCRGVVVGVSVGDWCSRAAACVSWAVPWQRYIRKTIKLCVDRKLFKLVS